MGLAAALLAVGVGLFVHQTHALEALELKSVDMRFALRGKRRPPSELAIVGIDPQTFSQLQLQWPFPRKLHAELIQRLRRDRVKAIVYDVQFTEPTTSTGGGRVAAREATDQDDALIDAVREAGNVVLATSEVGEHGTTDIFGGGGILGRIKARPGAAIFPPDSDGVIRRMIFSYRGLRTLGIVGAEAANGRTLSSSSLGSGKAWIDFAGPAGTIPEVPFVQVLRDEIPARALAGKTVIVGATASNLQDLHATPFNGAGLMSGSEITANAIATAEEGFPLRSVPEYFAIFLIVVLGASAPLLGLRLAPGWVLAACATVAATYFVVALLAFQAGVVVPFCDPMGALLLGCVGAIAADSFGERRRLQALVRARDGKFQFFISYRRVHSQWPAMVLYRALSDRFGKERVFIDTRAIDAGDIWPREIEQASAQCGAMLVLIGPGWADLRNPNGARRLDDPQDWVRREILAGLENPEAAVVPVIHDGAHMPTRDELPDALERLVECNAVPFSGEDIDIEINRLVKSVQSGRARSYARRELLMGGEPA